MSQDRSPADDIRRVEVRVRGRVQGVGFRDYICAAGRARGLAGWVRNCGDGSVEAQADGPPLLLQELVDLMRKGPSGARVATCSVTWIPCGPTRGTPSISQAEARPFKVRY